MDGKMAVAGINLARKGFEVAKDVILPHAKTIGVVGALATHSAAAYSSGQEAVIHAKKGNTGGAALAGSVSAGSAVVAVGPTAFFAGIAKASVFAKMAGPIKAILGYAGAIGNVHQAMSLKNPADAPQADRLLKGAAVRAVGATSSIAAAAVAGAAFGSWCPGAGTVAGALGGAAVAYLSDKYADSVEAAPLAQAPIVDIRSKLAERRALADAGVYAQPKAPKLG